MLARTTVILSFVIVAGLTLYAAVWNVAYSSVPKLTRLVAGFFLAALVFAVLYDKVIIPKLWVHFGLAPSDNPIPWDLREERLKLISAVHRGIFFFLTVVTLVAAINGGFEFSKSKTSRALLALIAFTLFFLGELAVIFLFSQMTTAGILG